MVYLKIYLTSLLASFASVNLRLLRTFSLNVAILCGFGWQWHPDFHVRHFLNALFCEGRLFCVDRCPAVLALRLQPPLPLG